MRNLVLVLACWVCLSNGQRGQALSVQMPSGSDAEPGEHNNPSRTFARFLVALNPTSGYVPPGAGVFIGKQSLSTSLASLHPEFLLTRRHPLANSAPVMGVADMDEEIARAQAEGEEDEPLMNDDIPYDEIRVSLVREVGEPSEELGIMDIDDALDMASEEDLDLVLFTENAKPPLCKIIDYSRFRYMEKKKKKEAKKNKGKTIGIKELRLSHKMGDNDFNTRKKQATKFLKAGDKVNFQMQFRGREVVFADQGKELMLRMSADLKEWGDMAKAPFMNGKYLQMSVDPKSKSQR